MVGRSKPVALRLEQGVDLPAAFESAAVQLEIEFCDVSAFGELEWVELHAAGSEDAQRLRGPLDLLDLKGRLRRAGEVVLADYVCTVSRATDSGVELLGGKLIAVQAVFVEVALIDLEPPEVESPEVEPPEVEPPEVDPPEVEPPEAEPRAEAAPEPAPAAESKPSISGRWAEALAESKRQERRAKERGWDWDSDEEELYPCRGDIVVHRQFGRCSVVRMGDEHISLRKPDGRVVQLGLSILDFSAIGAEDSKVVYDVKIRKD
ncbi:MAG: hypothetical protein JRF63_04240 [Deltaproteobacteria bacterium]|nr:hypothetical protein [Deltaproteobacteria bacterium]